MYSINMRASDTWAALKADRLLLWKTEQSKDLILEGDGEGYDGDDDDDEDNDATMTMTRRTLKRLYEVCHAG